jgi:prepilin-type N-terminal cleavage/methylation domain-containing protein
VPADAHAMHRRSDEGFTLIELVVAMSLAFVVLSGSFYLAAQSFRNSNAIESRATTTDQVQRGLDLLIHDLEHATSATVTTTGATLVIPSTTSTAAAVSPTPTTTVRWVCTANASCTRKLAAGTAVPQITGLVSAALTPTYATGSASTAPSFVQVQVQVRVVSQFAGANAAGASPAGVTGTMTFSDGAALRNFAR